MDHDTNLQFHNILKVLRWIKICWLWRLFAYSELSVMFQKPVWDDLSFMTQSVFLLEAVTRRWVHCGHKGMKMVSNNILVGCGTNNAQLVLKACAKKISLLPLHHHPCFHVVYTKFWHYPSNVRADIKIQEQTRRCFSKFLLSNFGEPWFPVLSWHEWHLVWSSTAVGSMCCPTHCCTVSECYLYSFENSSADVSKNSVFRLNCWHRARSVLSHQSRK